MSESWCELIGDSIRCVGVGESGEDGVGGVFVVIFTLAFAFA